ncbi:fimbrial biogenesis outer membrane usher protein [Neisseriaceae bacterium TC5R-5]|nr:fimbrial biogenesis outer membrane usher protein [Neisseriaceae bacterium TC5R-5]
MLYPARFATPAQGLFTASARCAALESMLCLLWASLVVAAESNQQQATAPPARFDSRLLLGSPAALGDVARLNQANAVRPGSYLVQLVINDREESQKQIEFRTDPRNIELTPCLDNDYLLRIGVLPTILGLGEQPVAANKPAEPNCLPLSERIPGSRSQFDFPRLRLNLSIPQASMAKVTRGSVPLTELDSGSRIAFINYDANYYSAHAQGEANNSLSVATNGGINLGMWRLRQQSTYSNANTDAKQWQLTRAYAQRTLPSLQSELTVGESFTRGNLLNSLSFRGIQIQSDEQMLPDSVRGYAPVVRGIAQTSARVTIRQGNRQIYQTTVAPGAFVIEDLSPTGTDARLEVEVQEADGRVSRFSVALANSPESIRPGLSRYSATLGRVRDIPGSQAAFGDFSYQRGMSNTITGNLATRIAQNYLAVLGGGVWGSSFGAFGLNTAYSNSLDGNNNMISGWRSSLNYSYVLTDSGTYLSLAAYHSASQDFRELTDAINARLAYQQGQTQAPAAHQQRHQFVANLNQNWGTYGQLSLSGSISNYYGDKQRDTQLQLAYSNNYHSLQYSLSFSRQLIGVSGGAAALTDNTNRASNVVMLSLMMPLGQIGRTTNWSSSLTQSGGRNNYRTSVSGLLGEARTLNYNLSASYDDQNHAANANIGLQQALPLASVSANYAQGQSFWQLSTSVQGAAALHAGGLTLGPSLSDTFALIEAPGATGATIYNGMGATINNAGYALLPLLSPYRYNDVVLENTGMNRQTELISNRVRVAPYAGMAVKLKFATRSGYAILIKATQTDGSVLPLGATVYDSKGDNVGMVGQGGQIYARVSGTSGQLTVTWGEQEQQCVLPYQFELKEQNAPLLYRIDSSCLARLEPLTQPRPVPD